jgi:hypothetical protein
MTEPESEPIRCLSRPSPFTFPRISKAHPQPDPPPQMPSTPPTSPWTPPVHEFPTRQRPKPQPSPAHHSHAVTRAETPGENGNITFRPVAKIPEVNPFRFPSPSHLTISASPVSPHFLPFFSSSFKLLVSSSHGSSCSAFHLDPSARSPSLAGVGVARVAPPRPPTPPGCFAFRACPQMRVGLRKGRRSGRRW